MTNQFDLTDDQREIQDLARRFTADRITPNAGEWDEKHHFPRDIIKAAAELGFASIYVSEDSGGIALGRLEAALIMEAMAYGCPSTSAFISIHNMASWMIDRFGSQGVKDKYLPSLVGMDRIASYCLTEPSSGSDAVGAEDPRGPRRRRLGGDGHQAVHLGRGRERGLCDDGPHRRGGTEGHFRAGDRERTCPACRSAQTSASSAGIRSRRAQVIFDGVPGAREPTWSAARARGSGSR